MLQDRGSDLHNIITKWLAYKVNPVFLLCNIIPIGTSVSGFPKFDLRHVIPKVIPTSGFKYNTYRVERKNWCVVPCELRKSCVAGVWQCTRYSCAFLATWHQLFWSTLYIYYSLSRIVSLYILWRQLYHLHLPHSPVHDHLFATSHSLQWTVTEWFPLLLLLFLLHSREVDELNSKIGATLICQWMAASESESVGMNACERWRRRECEREVNATGLRKGNGAAVGTAGAEWIEEITLLTSI